jgi:hypothetical protein
LGHRGNNRLLLVLRLRQEKFVPSGQVCDFDNSALPKQSASANNWEEKDNIEIFWSAAEVGGPSAKLMSGNTLALHFDALLTFSKLKRQILHHRRVAALCPS